MGYYEADTQYVLSPGSIHYPFVSLNRGRLYIMQRRVPNRAFSKVQEPRFSLESVFRSFRRLLLSQRLDGIVSRILPLFYNKPQTLQDVVPLLNPVD